MVNNRNFRFLCLVSLLCITAFSPNTSFAQLLNWGYEDVLTDLQQSGASPDMIKDDIGNLHVSYWNKSKDKLMYARRDRTTRTWTYEVVNNADDGGFKSAIAIDNTGAIHIAYYENILDLSYLRYATNASGSWMSESIDPTLELGLYGSSQVFAVATQLSLDIYIQDSGLPIISFFDATSGNYDAKCSTSPPSSNDYDLDLKVATMQMGGDWEVTDFNVPYKYSLICLTPGDRFGEFSKIVPDNSGGINVYTNSFHNAEFLQYSPPTTDSTDWTYTTLDSARRITGFNPPNSCLTDANPASTCFETFEYMDAVRGDEVFTHFVLGFSKFYGASITNNQTYFYANLDTAGNFFTHDFNPNGDAIYRKYHSIASKGRDTIFIASYNTSTNLIQVQSTYNRGQNWQLSNIRALLTNTTSPMTIVGDSLYVLMYDASADDLTLAYRPLSGGSWIQEQATTTEVRANYLSSEVIPATGSDEVYIAFDEASDDQLFYGERIGGNWTYNMVDVPGRDVKDISLALSQTNDPIIGYVHERDEMLKLAYRVGSQWNVDTVTTAAEPRDVSIGRYQNQVHVFYFDFLSRSLQHASSVLGSGNWTIETVDDSSDIVGQSPDLYVDASGGLHVAYIDFSYNTLRYAYRPQGGNWQLEAVTDSLTLIPASPSLKVTTAGKPMIAYRNSLTNEIAFAARNQTGVWSTSTILSGASNFLGSRIELELSPDGNPWVLYNFTSGTEQLRLLRRDANLNWNPVSVLNNNVQIANVFNIHRADKDLYIIGKKNQPDNNGIGLLFAPEGITTDLEELQSPIHEFNLYPNPSNGTTHIRFQLASNQKVRIQLLDLQGRPIQELLPQTRLDAGTHEHSIAIPELPNGMYFVRLSTDSFAQTQKWVLIHP